jgi:hypothetical protein
MKRVVAFVLLALLSGSWVAPAQAQQMSVAEYQRKSAKDAKKQAKSAKLQSKAQKKADKAQKKQLKAGQKADAKANRQLH